MVGRSNELTVTILVELQDTESLDENGVPTFLTEHCIQPLPNHLVYTAPLFSGHPGIP